MREVVYTKVVDKKQLKKAQNLNVQNRLEIYMFEPTDGLDPDIC